MTGQTRETSRRMLARFLFFFLFFCFFFFDREKSTCVGVRLDSMQLHDFRPKVFRIKRAMNKRNTDASILGERGEGFFFFFRGAESKRAKYLYRLCQLSAARAPFRSDVQKNNAKAIMQGGWARGSHRCSPLTIPESATRPSTRRATIRAIIMFSLPFFLGNVWERRSYTCAVLHATRPRFT